MEQALKPCPFCGGLEVRCCDTGLFWISCDSCGAEGPTSIKSKEEAVQEWNKRPTAIEASPVVGEIEAVGDLIERLNIIAAHRCANDMGFDRETGPLGCALEAQPGGSCFCAGVIPAARQAAASLASLQPENQALREEVEQWAAVANREDECRKDWQSRAEAAESQVQSLTLKLEERDKALKATLSDFESWVQIRGGVGTYRAAIDRITRAVQSGGAEHA